MLADVTTKQRFSLTSWFYTISIYPGKIALKGHSQKKKKFAVKIFGTQKNMDFQAKAQSFKKL